MALSNVLPEVWRNVVLAGLRKNLPAELICNKKFKEEVWGKGDTLHILGLGALTDKEYEGTTITYEALSDTDTTLLINKQQYVAFVDEDAVKAKTNVEYKTELMTDAGYQLGDYWDNLVMAEYANAGLDSFATGSTPWQITFQTAANLPSLFGALKRQLKVANAPVGEVYFIAPPQIEEAITLYYGNKGPGSNLSDAYAQNANFMGKYFGVNVFTSNNCVTGSSVTHGLAGVMGTSIALANDVITDEAIRLEGIFGTGTRMLSIGGVKTYRSAISIDVNLNEVVIAAS